MIGRFRSISFVSVFLGSLAVFVIMIDGSEKRNRWLGLEFQSSHIIKKKAMTRRKASCKTGEENKVFFSITLPLFSVAISLAAPRKPRSIPFSRPFNSHFSLPLRFLFTKRTCGMLTSL